MIENTPFDYVWLGLLIGVFDLGDTERGWGMLMDQLADMGLGETLTRLLDAEETRSGSYESDDIARWVGEEIEAQPTPDRSPSGFNIHASAAELIGSIPPGVWSWLPQHAQNGLIEAEHSIRNGQLDGAAFLVFRSVETIFRGFYLRLTPNSATDLSMSEMTKNLFDRNERDLVPLLYTIRDLWRNERNPTVHEDKSYDKYEIISLWHLALRAIVRIARVLERRFPPLAMD